MAERQASTLQSFIYGHHIYKQIWQQLVEEILTLEREEGNNRDKFAVSFSSMLLSLAMFLESFRGSVGTSSSTCEVIDQRKRGKATSQH